MTEVAKYLVCVDANEASRAAIRLAGMQASHHHAAIELLHIIPPMELQVIGAIGERLRAEQRAAADQLLHQHASFAMKQFRVPVSVQLREGEIGEMILQAAAEDPRLCALVLAAAHPSAARGRLVAWLAAQLNDGLKIPLLLVPSHVSDGVLEQIT